VVTRVSVLRRSGHRLETKISKRKGKKSPLKFRSTSIQKIAKGHGVAATSYQAILLLSIERRFHGEQRRTLISDSFTNLFLMNLCGKSWKCQKGPVGQTMKLT
jgi:hypothetical protein